MGPLGFEAGSNVSISAAMFVDRSGLTGGRGNSSLGRAAAAKSVWLEASISDDCPEFRPAFSTEISLTVSSSIEDLNRLILNPAASL